MSEVTLSMCCVWTGSSGDLTQPETRNPKPEARNPELEIRNLKPKARAAAAERIVIELMTSDRTLKASSQGSKKK